MQVVIGYGNRLRGEDAFGVDVVKCLKEKMAEERNNNNNIKLLELYQLTPELCIDLLDASKLIFVDAYALGDTKNQHDLACDIETINTQTNSLLSHHISYKMILEMMSSLYQKNPSYTVYSMCTNQFDKIMEKEEYEKRVKEVCLDIYASLN